MNAYDVIIKPVLTEKAYDGISAARAVCTGPEEGDGLPF